MFIIPTFVHPRAKEENIINYIDEVTPESVLCLDKVMYNRAIFENFTREGRNLHEYAQTVKNNKQAYNQAIKAIEDIENIVKEFV